MRIGIETSALAVDTGGTAGYVSNLLARLERQRNGHTLYTFRFGSRPPARKTLATRLGSLWRDLVWSQFVLPGLATRQRLNILHLTGGALPLWSDCPRVVTVHDVAIMRYREYFTSWMVYYARLVRRHAIQRADAVITTSEFGRREIANTLGIPSDRIVVVPLGIADCFFDEPPAERLDEVRTRLQLERPFLLHVGVLSPRKNLERLLRAFDRLRTARAIPHQLILAGGRGWKDDAIVRLVSELDPAGKDIRHIGQVSGDLPALYRLADLVVYPSLYETFGLPPLEAMACGTPVVASNVTAIPEVVGDAALLIDPADEEALAGGIYRALTDEALRQHLIERGHSRAATFTWDRTVRATLDVYEHVASHKGLLQSEFRPTDNAGSVLRSDNPKSEI